MLLVFIYAILFVCHDALCAVHHLMMTIQLNSDSPSALLWQINFVIIFFMLAAWNISLTLGCVQFLARVHFECLVCWVWVRWNCQFGCFAIPQNTTKSSNVNKAQKQIVLSVKHFKKLHYIYKKTLYKSTWLHRN